jgi:hypothetical protein
MGRSSAGAYAAARNTARLAVFIFLLGFAQPGLGRLISRLPSAAVLIQAFVCAQVVHFVTVIITVVLDKSHFLRHFSVAGALTVLIGASVILGEGFTPYPSQSRIVRRLHQGSLYLVSLIFLPIT